MILDRREKIEPVLLQSNNTYPISMDGRTILRRRRETKEGEEIPNLSGSGGCLHSPGSNVR